MAKKQFNLTVSKTPARPRNKRMREVGVVTSGGGAVVNIVGSGESVEGHTHENKSDLDQLTVDENGYIEITTLRDVTDPETGEQITVPVTEKVKAGYADKVGYAEKAAHADKADEAETAKVAETAKTAERAKLADVAKDLTNDSPVLKKFLSREKDDDAEGYITLKKGAQFGSQFIPGQDGTGGQIDSAGNGELESLKLRGFLEVPELRFNRIDVVSGELWNSVAFGLIESVEIDKDENGTELESGVITLHLEEKEYGGMAVDDLCRGMFHNLTQEESGTDDCGFDRIRGFATSYFRVSAAPYGDYKNRFRYELRPSENGFVNPHPCKGMKYAVYGNQTKKDRQYSAYHTGKYTRYLSGVNTWVISPSMIKSQFGDLSGLSLNGVTMEGYGSMQQNAYLFGTHMQLNPETVEDMKHELGGYSCSLSSYEGILHIAADATEVTDGDLVIPSLVSATVMEDETYREKLLLAEQDGATWLVGSNRYVLYTTIEAYKGDKQLSYSNNGGAGRFTVELDVHGLEAKMDGGTVYITKVTQLKGAFLTMRVNCGGDVVFTKRYYVKVVRDGEGVVTGDLGNAYQQVAAYADGSAVVTDLSTGYVAVRTNVYAYYGAAPMPVTDVQVVSVTNGRDEEIPGDLYDVEATRNPTGGPGGIAIGVVRLKLLRGFKFDDTNVMRIDLSVKAKSEGGTVYPINTLRMCVGALRAGADGEVPTIYGVEAIPNAVLLKEDGTYSPGQLRLHVWRIENGKYLSGSGGGLCVYKVDGVQKGEIINELTLDLDTLKPQQNIEVSVMGAGGSGYDTETVPVLRNGEDGKDGTDGIAYTLTAPVTNFGRDSLGNRPISSTTVTALRNGEKWDGGTFVLWGTTDGKKHTELGRISNTTQTLVQAHNDYPVLIVSLHRYGSQNNSPSNALATLTITSVSDGQNVAAGAYPYNRGEYNPDETYTFTKDRRDCVWIKVGDASRVYMVKEFGAILEGVDPSTDTEGAYWIPANMEMFTAISTALIDGANIAGFLYKDSVMRSQAENKDGQPYLVLDGEKGFIEGTRLRLGIVDDDGDVVDGVVETALARASKHFSGSLTSYERNGIGGYVTDNAVYYDSTILPGVYPPAPTISYAGYTDITLPNGSSNLGFSSWAAQVGACTYTSYPKTSDRSVNVIFNDPEISDAVARFCVNGVFASNDSAQGSSALDNPDQYTPHKRTALAVSSRMTRAQRISDKAYAATNLIGGPAIHIEEGFIRDMTLGMYVEGRSDNPPGEYCQIGICERSGETAAVVVLAPAKKGMFYALALKGINSTCLFKAGTSDIVVLSNRDGENKTRALVFFDGNQFIDFLP